MNPIRRGVVWPREYWPANTSHLPAADWLAALRPYLIGSLADLVAHHCNTIWTENGPDDAGELALLCQLAAERSVDVVLTPSPGVVPSNPPGVLAVSAADEPGDPAQFQALAKAWQAAGAAVTTVFTGDAVTKTGLDQFVRVKVDGGTRDLGLPFVAMDYYAFSLDPKSANVTAEQSQTHYATTVQYFCSHAKAIGQHPWVMFQAFAAPAVKGNSAFRMPTPAELRWQIRCAATAGAEAVIAFVYSPSGGLLDPAHGAHWAVVGQEFGRLAG